MSMVVSKVVMMWTPAIQHQSQVWMLIYWGSSHSSSGLHSCIQYAWVIDFDLIRSSFPWAFINTFQSTRVYVPMKRRVPPKSGAILGLSNPRCCTMSKLGQTHEVHLMRKARLSEREPRWYHALRSPLPPLDSFETGGNVFISQNIAPQARNWTPCICLPSLRRFCPS